MLPAPITIPNPLPATLVALSGEAIEQRDDLVVRSATIRQAGITDVVTFGAADALHRELSTFARDVEKGRASLKAPILAIGRALDAAAKEALEAIEAEQRQLGAMVKAYQDAENARREAEHKAAQEKARRDAEEAQQRLEAEARQRAELEALPGEEPAPLDFASVPTVKAAPVAVAPPLKSSVRKVTRRVVVIDSAAAVPFEVNGIRLWREPDTAAIKLLLERGVAVPGARLVEDTSTASTGR